MIRRTGLVTLVALAAALVAISAASGLAESRKPIRIDLQGAGYEQCAGKFLLSLGRSGDIGKAACHFVEGASGKTPEGLDFTNIKLTATLTGKKGTLVIVSTGHVYDLGNGPSDVWEGTWSISKGTGSYAGIHGGGIWKGADNLNSSSEAIRYAGSATGA